VIGEFVEYRGDYYILVMSGNRYYGVVTLRSSPCSPKVVLVIEQACASIVIGKKRTMLLTLYGDPSDVFEYFIGNILDREDL